VTHVFIWYTIPCPLILAATIRLLPCIVMLIPPTCTLDSQDISATVFQFVASWENIQKPLYNDSVMGIMSTESITLLVFLKSL
jgi:hypothetical protein